MSCHPWGRQEPDMTERALSCLSQMPPQEHTGWNFHPRQSDLNLFFPGCSVQFVGY